MDHSRAPIDTKRRFEDISSMEAPCAKPSKILGTRQLQRHREKAIAEIEAALYVKESQKPKYDDQGEANSHS